jgi:hypothetical protein
MVDSTLDGGISIWLNEIKDPDGKARELKRWMLLDGENVELPADTFQKYKQPKPGDATQDQLNASCHCGGVKFYITRPNEASKNVYSPFPDLMVPYHTGQSPENPGKEPWWLRSNGTKYLAGTCTCRSCRKALGFEIQTWAFVPRYNIFDESGDRMVYDMGSLKQYLSSEGIWREFCGVCGATVFWHCAERPDLVDISVGLFNPEEGARAEGWLDWWSDRVSFEEMAESSSLIRSLENGLRNWGKSKET